MESELVMHLKNWIYCQFLEVEHYIGKTELYDLSSPDECVQYKQ